MGRFRVLGRLLLSLAGVASLLVLAVLGPACGGNAVDSDGVRVVATTAVIGEIAREVGGDRVQLSVLIPAGSDPHDFELTSGARRAVDGAALILRHGLGLDEFLDSVLDSVSGRVVTVSDGARLRVAGDQPDPHIWLDADNAALMVRNVAEALGEADPEGRPLFEAAADDYVERIRTADEQARRLVSAVPEGSRLVVTNHDSVGYLLERYGIQSLGSVIPGLSTAAEPSAKDVARLQELIKERGVRAILAEGSTEAKIARQLAADTGVVLVDDLFGDTLGEPGSPTGSLDGVIIHDVERIVAAIQEGG